MEIAEVDTAGPRWRNVTIDSLVDRSESPTFYDNASELAEEDAGIYGLWNAGDDLNYTALNGTNSTNDGNYTFFADLWEMGMLEIGGVNETILNDQVVLNVTYATNASYDNEPYHSGAPWPIMQWRCPNCTPNPVMDFQNTAIEINNNSIWPNYQTAWYILSNDPLWDNSWDTGDLELIQLIWNMTNDNATGYNQSSADWSEPAVYFDEITYRIDTDPELFDVRVEFEFWNIKQGLDNYSVTLKAQPNGSEEHIMVDVKDHLWGDWVSVCEVTGEGWKYKTCQLDIDPDNMEVVGPSNEVLIRLRGSEPSKDPYNTTFLVDYIHVNGSKTEKFGPPFVLGYDHPDTQSVIIPYEKKYLPSFIIDLKDGCNLISIPLIPSTMDLNIILDLWVFDAVPTGRRIYRYNASHTSDLWQTYSVDKKNYFNDLNSASNHEGYWLCVDATGPLGNAYMRVSGYLSTDRTNITLQPGWNMVGYPTGNLEGGRPQTVDQAFNDTAGIALRDGDTSNGEVTKVIRQNKPGGPLIELEDSDQMLAGMGYWVYYVHDSGKAMYWSVNPDGTGSGAEIP
jgi:hypothetical protein